MDKIIGKGLSFMACHGVLPEEKVTPQKFIVDLELYKDLRQAGLSDDLSKTINYDEVYQDVKEIVEGNSFDLIEKLAETIADNILNKYPISAIKVIVYKPNAPVNGEFEYFAVDIYRQKN